MALQIFLYSLISGTQVLLFALVLHLVYSVSKVHNLAFGAIAASVAYALYFAVATPGLPLILCFVLPLIAAVGLGVVCYFLNESFTRRQQPLFALLVSFSFGILLESLITIFFGTDGKNFTPTVLPVFSFGDYQIPLSGLGIILIGGVSALLAFFMIHYTPWGRALKATSENQFSAGSLGINQGKTRLIIYIITSVVVGIVGILSGLNTALTPSMGFNLVIMGFIAFLLGGVGDVLGTIVASYLVALIPELLINFSYGLSANWKMALVFGVAAVIIAFRPSGLFAPITRKS